MFVTEIIESDSKFRNKLTNSIVKTEDTGSALELFEISLDLDCSKKDSGLVLVLIKRNSQNFA